MKPPAAQIEWLWNDGWLLMAVLLAQGEAGAQLHELIAAADATNHAIPTSRELSSALTNFIRCGLVAVSRDRYHLSPQYLPDVQKAYQGRGGLFAAGDKGLRWLKRSGLAPGNTERVEFSEAQVKAAYDLYIGALRSK
jgi:hypothetical protein